MAAVRKHGWREAWLAFASKGCMSFCPGLLIKVHGTCTPVTWACAL